MRTGASEGIVLEAIAEAASVDGEPYAAPRSSSATCRRWPRSHAGAAPRRWRGSGPKLFVPFLPMLAEIATDFGEVLAAHGGRTALEYKYDGARAQIHSDGARVAIWTRRPRRRDGQPAGHRRLCVRRDLRGAPFIVDGEVVALDAAGRPLPFQELMRRFRRVHGVESLAGEMPLGLHLFDCLMVEGRSLIDEPYATRWEALAG